MKLDKLYEGKKQSNMRHSAKRSCVFSVDISGQVPQKAAVTPPALWTGRQERNVYLNAGEHWQIEILWQESGESQALMCFFLSVKCQFSSVSVLKLAWASWFGGVFAREPCGDLRWGTMAYYPSRGLQLSTRRAELKMKAVGGFSQPWQGCRVEGYF